MPRMATLSRIPLAIFNLLSESRRGLPEIPPETAILVERLDSEHHPQIGADIQRVTRKIGEFGHHPSAADKVDIRSEEHTSELQSLMRISYAVFCLKKKKPYIITTP